MARSTGSGDRAEPLQMLEARYFTGIAVVALIVAAGKGNGRMRVGMRIPRCAVLESAGIGMAGFNIF